VFKHTTTVPKLVCQKSGGILLSNDELTLLDLGVIDSL
jgi:hypothetical protein